MTENEIWKDVVGFEIDTLYADMANERIADAIVKREESGGGKR